MMKIVKVLSVPPVSVYSVCMYSVIDQMKKVEVLGVSSVCIYDTLYVCMYVCVV